MKHRRNRDRLLVIVLSVAMLFGVSLIANADYAKTSVSEPSVSELSVNEPSPVEPLHAWIGHSSEYYIDTARKHCTNATSRILA